jgi:hypothetical protein
MLERQSPVVKRVQHDGLNPNGPCQLTNNINQQSNILIP